MDKLEFFPPPDWVYCECCKDWFPPKDAHFCWKVIEIAKPVKGASDTL